MNLRIGAFGRQEAASAVWIATFTSGCFAFDNHAQFADGNAACLTYAGAALLSLLLFEAVVAVLRRRRGRDLLRLFGNAKWKSVLALPLFFSLLLAAMQPLQLFLVTVTEYIFVEARQVSICMVLLPCLLLLTALGAETLVRTSRLLLPLLLVSVAATLLLAVSQYRTYRLFPIPLGSAKKLVAEGAGTLFRTFSPLLALLCIGEGSQNVRAMQSAGRIGALGGMLTTGLLLLGLGLSFSYVQLREMPSPFFRLLIEVRTENPTMRLDRATLFLWMSAAMLSSAFYLYAACVLLAKTCGIADIRPLAICVSALAVTLILVLYYDSDTTVAILRGLYRFAWIAAIVPIPLLLLGNRKGGGECDLSASHC